MTVTVKHSKTNAISDWTQAQLDEQIALGNFAEGTVLADIVLPSDWNNDHTLTGVGTMAEQDANNVAITGGSINGTTIGATIASTGTFTTLIGGANVANYGQLTGGATTKAVEFMALGTDSNISIALDSKGTGAIDLAAGSSGVNISNGGTVTAVTRTAQGTGYTTLPTWTASAPTTAGGVTASGSATSLGGVSATIAGGGTGYTAGNVLTVSGGTFSSASTITVNAVSGGVITSATLTNGGTYTVIPANPVSVTGGTGTGATFNVSYGIVGLTTSVAGSGYIEQPTVSFSGGGGSGASAYAHVGSQSIIRTLASPLSLFVPGGEAFRVSDGGATSAAYWNVFSGSTSPILRAVGSASGVIQTGSAVPIQFTTNASTSSTEQFRVSHTASAVNYVQVTGATTLNPPVISSQGSDSTIAMIFQAKGGQNFRFFSAAGSAEQFRVIHTAGTIANYAQATGNVAGSAPAFSVNGSDTNIDLALTPKGTGLVRFGTYVAGALIATGYINIKAADGTTYKVLVST